MIKNIDDISGEAGTFAKIIDAYANLNKLWPLLYPFKKIKRILKKTDDNTQPTIDNISFLLRRKIEKCAKEKFHNDPKAIEKAILEAKDLWLTNARRDDFMNNSVKRKLKKKNHQNNFMFGSILIKDIVLPHVCAKKDEDVEWENLWHHFKDINNRQDIYTKIVDELGVPRPTVRRVSRDLRTEILQKIQILQSDILKTTTEKDE